MQILITTHSNPFSGKTGVKTIFQDISAGEVMDHPMMEVIGEHCLYIQSAIEKHYERKETNAKESRKKVTKASCKERL